MKLTWNILFKALNKRFWNEGLCWVPTFCTELEGEKLGDFEFTPQGFNLIKLASNQGLTDREACGVLLHEMCHQAVFEKHGYELDGHGIEWQTEIIIERFESSVPQNFSDLESLPGVGHKTASVVMAQAFGVPTFPVDTHIHRLAQRWGLSNGSSVIQTEKDLKSIFPKTAWNKLHLQIIYYGREHCTARGCDGTTCDLCQELYPKRCKPVIWTKP